MEWFDFDDEGDLILKLFRQPVSTAGSIKNTCSNNAELLDSSDSVSDTPSTAKDDEDLMEIAPALEGAVAKNSETMEEVCMLVCSKAMKRVSPVFKAMLSRGTFKEGLELSDTGRVEVPLPDDNVEAMIIALDIIHSRNRRVPRQVDFDTLFNLTILADKYQMVEAIEAYSTGWAASLRAELPRKYEIGTESEQVVHKWIAISWVFELPEEFQKMTELVQLNCTASLRDRIQEGLPIPDLIIESIQRSRIKLLSECYMGIKKEIEDHQNPPTFTAVQYGLHWMRASYEAYVLRLCSRTDSIELRSACDAMLLGSLLKEATAAGLYPTPDAPYGENTFLQFKAKVENLNLVALCDKINVPPTNFYAKPNHSLKQAISARLDYIGGRVGGLNLNYFKYGGRSLM